MVPENAPPISDAEIEELINTDETPEPSPRPYRHSKEFYQKKLREQEKEERAKQRLDKSESKDWFTAHRQERIALFESEPMIPSTDPQVMLSSARLFAQLLRMDDVRQRKPPIDDVRTGESLRSFCTRVHERWSRGVTVDGGILPARQYKFPLVMLGDTWAAFSLFSGWPPDNTGKVLKNEPQLPEFWPEGSDEVLDLRRLPEPLGEGDRRPARLQMQMETAKAEEPRLIQWVRNQSGMMEPKTIFTRPSVDTELRQYRLGFTWQAGPEHPKLTQQPHLAGIRIRMSQADLQSIAEQDFQVAQNEIRRRANV